MKLWVVGPEYLDRPFKHVVLVEYSRLLFLVDPECLNLRDSLVLVDSCYTTGGTLSGICELISSSQRQRGEV